MSKSFLVLMLAGAIALAGCAQQKTEPPAGDDGGATSDGDGADAGPEPTWESTFVASDYAFSGPTTMHAGWNEITLQNDGRELHHMNFMLLPEGITFEMARADLMGADDEGDSMGDGMDGTSGNMTHDNMSTGDGTDGNMSDEEDPFEAIRAFGGPNAVHPGKSEVAWIELEAGRYAVACWIPAPDGMPHAMKGMLLEVEVLPATGGPAPPEADVEIALDDYAFDASTNLTAGTHTVKFTNTGDHPHEAALIRLDGNATAMDFIGHFAPDSNATGPPPGQGAGGINTLQPGDAGYTRLTLTPGRYVFICFESDGDGAPPHFALGMLHEFTVA